MNSPRDAAQSATNWDSYGGKPTTAAAIETAERINDSWVPTRTGGLMIDCSIDVVEITVVIAPDGSIESIAIDRVRRD